MINEYKLYSVKCDLCDCEYSDTTPGLTDNLPTYFQSKKDAEETITSKGWVVMHNKPGNYPRILCPECNMEAERVMNRNYEPETSRNKTHLYPQQG